MRRPERNGSPRCSRAGRVSSVRCGLDPLGGVTATAGRGRRGRRRPRRGMHGNFSDGGSRGGKKFCGNPTERGESATNVSRAVGWDIPRRGGSGATGSTSTFIFFGGSAARGSASALATGSRRSPRALRKEAEGRERIRSRSTFASSARSEAGVRRVWGAAA